MEEGNKQSTSKSGQHKQSSSGQQNGALDDSLLDNHGLNLPKEVIRRVNALKNIQVNMVDIETKFYDELHHLECKYTAMFEPWLNSREKIVNGDHEPTDEESKWTLDDLTGENPADLTDDMKKLNLGAAGDSANATKGIPEFWLTAMKNTDIIGETIQEHDEQILKYLKVII